MSTESVELTIKDIDGNKVTISISKTEILLNGVRYVPDKTMPNKISIYLMRDNHSTIRISGSTTKKVLTEIKKAKLSSPDASSGTIFIMNDSKELERLYFTTNKLDELETILSRDDIQILLPTSILVDVANGTS